MKIDIKLNKEYVEKLLKIYDYVTEDVLVWYNKLDDDRVIAYGKYWKKVAYPRNCRPEALNAEKIKAEEVEEYGLEEVVENLFSHLLMAKLMP